MTNQFVFKPLEDSDLDLLCHWLSQPHVKEWWNDHLTDEEIKSKYKERIGDSIVVPFIVFMHDQPIGFIQYYHADKVGCGWWPDEVTGTIGIDQFIGEKDLINRGIGTKMIKAFVDHLFKNSNIKKIITDVDPKNLRALRCYEKVGFEFVKEIMTPDGRASLMMMNNHHLGLPLEYQQMPEYFDAHNVGADTETKNALIAKLLKEQHVKTVLDMTCGTGSQVFYLTLQGFKVIGSDFSHPLIEIARHKALKANKNITFLDGDMRDLHVGKFDAVITIFNAIGHLTKPDFEKALKNIHANLNDDGIYIFDIFNLQAITNDVIDDFAMDIESIVNGVKIRNVQHSEIDRTNGLLTSHDHYTLQKNDSEPEIHTNRFSLQIYTAHELQTIMQKNGFEIIHQYDMAGNDFIAEKSLNILTVARKKKT